MKFSVNKYNDSLFVLHFLSEHTAKRIQKHISDKTFFATTAVEKGTTLLDSSHIMVLAGTEKCGKTEACLSICSSFKAKGFAVIYMTASNCFEAENMSYYVEKDKTELFVFDINMKPTEEDARNNLLAEANLYASENNKFIFTIKTSTGKRGLESFHQRQQVTMDCFTKDDKRGILMKHMQYNNLDECINYLEANYEDSEKLKDDEKIKIPRKVIDDIVEAETTGQFPELCKLFCSTRSLLPLEDRYFKNPSKSLIHDIHQLRSKTETKVLYVTLVYVLMKDTFDESEDQDVIKKSINTICEKMTIASYNPYDIKDAAIELVNKYIYLIEESGRFMFSNEWIKKAVWISYMDIDQKYCVMHCQWEYVSDLLRPNAWPKQNTDVCIRVNTPELTRRLKSEMKNTGSAWSVGTYLRKLSGNGKELTDAFCFDCMQTSGLEHKADTLLSFFNGISDLGKDVQVFSYSKSIRDLVQWHHMDKHNNSILHFCIMQNFEFMCNDTSKEFLEPFFKLKNKKKHSPCAFAFYFGRSQILEKHAENIPLDYEFYRILERLFSVGEKHAGKNLKSKHMTILPMDLPPNLFDKLKFGKRKDFNAINNILEILKHKTMVMIRVKGLPSEVGNDKVKVSLSSQNCTVIKLYHEKYRQKGKLTNIDTGDHIAVCKFTKNPLPLEIEIENLNVTTESMVTIKLLHVPSFLKDYQIQNALSLQNCKVKDLIPEFDQSSDGESISYIAVCSPMEKELPETIPIEQNNIRIKVMTTIKFKRLPKNIIISEIENVLQHHNFVVHSTYREKRRQEGILTNIKTGDRIAICKPFLHQLPRSLSVGKFVADIEYNRGVVSKN